MPEPPVVPQAVESVYGLFWLLNDSRPRGFDGLDLFAPSEIEAWARIQGITLTPELARALLAMDSAWVRGAQQARSEAFSAKDEKNA